MSSKSSPIPQQVNESKEAHISKGEIYRLQPDDLDVTRNNEATNEFQARTIELRNQRPQWITYYQ
jgi:hypothetical protein